MLNTLFVKLDDVLQTLWVGGLLIVGYMVAPVLFGSLDDRRLAGELAGHMFSAINIIGLVCGAYLLLRCALIVKGRFVRTARVWALVLMLILIAVAMFVLQPMMQELKAVGITPGSDAASQFGRLHGVSSVLYLVTSLLGLYLVVGKKPAL